MSLLTRTTLLLALLIGVMVFHPNGSSQTSQLQAIPLPDGKSGIGFDDLQYANHLQKVLIPSGRSGNLNLIDPSNLSLVTLSGFSSERSFQGGHGEGTTSADEGNGFLFAI